MYNLTNGVNFYLDWLVFLCLNAVTLLTKVDAQLVHGFITSYNKPKGVYA